MDFTKTTQILIIDDDVVDRMAIIRQLKAMDLGLNFCESDTYEHAVMLVRNSHFDCILLDYHLPDATGIDFIKYLQDEGVLTPVIVLTGQGDEGIAVESMKAGALDYLVKGNIRPESLRHAVNASIRLAEAREEAHTARRMVVQAEKMAFLGTTVAGMAHEINQPLNAIKLASGVLLYRLRQGEEIDNDEVFDTLTQITAWCERINGVINEVRTFVRTDYSISQGSCDLNSAVWSVYDMFKDKIGASGIAVETVIAKDLPEIRAERRRLEEVITNILANAIHALEDMDQPEKTILITTALIEDKVVLEIKDNGPGVDSAIQDKIFEPFFSTKSSGKGMGLGLAIVQSFIRSFGGNIGFRNDVNGGAVFFIQFLPMEA